MRFMLPFCSTAHGQNAAPVDEGQLIHRQNKPKHWQLGLLRAKRQHIRHSNVKQPKTAAEALWLRLPHQVRLC